MQDQAQTLRTLMKQAAQAATQPSRDEVNGHTQATVEGVPAAAAITPSPRTPRLLVVAGGKGGVGATTVAIQVAKQLARDSRRVLLIDADVSQGDVASMSGIFPTASLHEVLRERIPFRAALEPGPNGMLVVAARLPSEDRSSAKATIGASVANEIRHCGDIADWVIVDVGSGTNVACWQAIGKVADALALVTTADTIALMNAYAIIKQASNLGISSPVHLLWNEILDEQQLRERHQRLELSCRRFLNRDVFLVGWIPADPKLSLGDCCEKAADQSVLPHPSIQKFAGYWLDWFEKFAPSTERLE